MTVNAKASGSALWRVIVPTLILAVSCSAAGDTGSGVISGRVQNPSGVAAAGAKVILSDESGRQIGTTTASSTGTYQFDSVKPGNYGLKAECAGFLPSALSKVDVSVRGKVTVNLILQTSKSTARQAPAQGELSKPPEFYDSTSLRADELSGSVDPAGYSSAANAYTTAHLLEGAAALEQNRAAPLTAEPKKSSDVPGHSGAPSEAEPENGSEQNIFHRGYELLVQRKVDDAIEVFQSAVTQYPKSPELQIGLGIALYLSGRHDEAVQCLVQATVLEPANDSLYSFLAYANGVSPQQQTVVRERLKRFAEANPENARAVYYYALSLWKGSRADGKVAGLAQVESLLKESVALDPKFPESHLQLGAFYASEEKYPQAIEEYQQAIALDSTLSEAHYRLGQALARTGRQDEAAREFKTYDELRRRSNAPAGNGQEKVHELIELMNGKDPTR